jgi:hypothetical protein
MWLLPLLVIGLAVALAGHRDRPITSGLGPLAMLGRCIQTGRPPPPQIILCAIAEAEDLGRPDVASKIVRTFVEPVVREHNRRLAEGARQRALTLEPACGLAEDIDDAEVISQAALPAAEVLALAAGADDDDLDAVLERAAALEQGREAVLVKGQRSEAAERSLGYAQPPISALLYPVGREVDNEARQLPSVFSAAQALALQLKSGPERRPKAAALSAPIDGVAASSWEAFIDRLVREAPAYQSAKHVGQYRQRKDRLAELGLDYRKLLGDERAQRAALETDLADAYKHATAGGMLQHVGRPVAIPGREEPTRVTLSGVLGVIQAAGLEGAESWFSRQQDRKAFPHTTAAYVRTNGGF